ncbi:tRNA uridine-5-carboxymethylaminomethyl(34) synthesis GTPase MnmE [Rhodobacterales bacterium 52_120_T64]|nr:tRNA uridine-5-carboxymethylaminomethyl(34) synthesis GTPase MnmE [Rhodobacterales bacterium 52_120_T64]
MHDTIFALATARGRAGVAVVRVSGPLAWDAVAGMVVDLPEPRRAALRVVRTHDEEPIDEALILTFEAGASFTGDRVVEIHLHGSAAVVAAVLRELSDTEGVRLAEAGEFTRQALDNGQLDLAQVEGLADLIDAETEAQRRQALSVMRGALSKKTEIWRKTLIRAVALLEVTIDFADEEVPVDVSPEVLNLIDSARGEMQIEADGSGISERIRDGFEVAIIGRPNIGKSTLLNMLAKKDAAIVSAIAGTTRDVIEVRMDLGGLPITLLDTAGLRVSDDEVEILGVERAKARAETADIRVFLLEAGESHENLDVGFRQGDIIAYGKADIARTEGLSVSGLTGSGVDQLLHQLSNELAERAAGASSAVRERHRIALIDGIGALDSAEIHVKAGAEWSDLAAEEMRQALRSLDTMIGRVDVENVLDVIFSSFCIGK